MIMAAYGSLQQTSCICFPRRPSMQLPVATFQQLTSPVAPCRQLQGARRRPSHSSSRMALGRLQAAPADVGTFISKTEIPAFIPRQDLMEQLFRWAQFASYDVDKVAKFGLPVKAEPYYKDEDVLWGITLSIIRDGEAATEIGIRFDNEENEKHEWVGRGADGFPTLEGKKVPVVGKHLEIRKLDDRPIDEEVRSCIRNICEDLVAAINKYYAFGSAFADEAT